MRGEQLAGRYQLVELLGRGGMGEVWHGQDLRLERPVAVKLTLPTSMVEEEAVQRFTREARAAARLTHPNVVTVHDVGAVEDQLYLVMELVQGRSLDRVLHEQGPLPAADVADVGAQVARGLAVAHDAGVVHRDVKPGNMLRTRDGTVKVTDFGLAQLVDTGTRKLTQAGAVVGTWAYMAPEQVMGHQAGPLSDLYSLGCVLYELLVGQPPFRSENTAQLVYQHAHTTPVPPSQLRPDVPAELEWVVLRLLAKDPQHRVSGADELVHRLAELSGKLRSGHAAAPPARHTVSPSTGPQPAAPQPAAPQPTGPQPTGPQPGVPQPAGPQRGHWRPPAAVRRGTSAWGWLVAVAGAFVVLGLLGVHVLVGWVFVKVPYTVVIVLGFLDVSLVVVLVTLLALLLTRKMWKG